MLPTSKRVFNFGCTKLVNLTVDLSKGKSSLICSTGKFPSLISVIYWPVTWVTLFFWTKLCFPLWFRMAHVLQFDEQTRKVKDANMQDADTFEIYDPRNPVNKRRREESKKLMKEKKARRWASTLFWSNLPVWIDHFCSWRVRTVVLWDFKMWNSFTRPIENKMLFGIPGCLLTIEMLVKI